MDKNIDVYDLLDANEQIFKEDKLFFEDINEWDNFCNELDLT